MGNMSSPLTPSLTNSLKRLQCVDPLPPLSFSGASRRQPSSKTCREGTWQGHDREQRPLTATGEGGARSTQDLPSLRRTVRPRAAGEPEDPRDLERPGAVEARGGVEVRRPRVAPAARPAGSPIFDAPAFEP